jgi:hypothetical protein
VSTAAHHSVQGVRQPALVRDRHFEYVPRVGQQWLVSGGAVEARPAAEDASEGLAGSKGGSHLKRCFLFFGKSLEPRAGAVKVRRALSVSVSLRQFSTSVGDATVVRYEMAVLRCCAVRSESSRKRGTSCFRCHVSWFLDFSPSCLFYLLNPDWLGYIQQRKRRRHRRRRVLFVCTCTQRTLLPAQPRLEDASVRTTTLCNIKIDVRVVSPPLIHG